VVERRLVVTDLPPPARELQYRRLSCHFPPPGGDRGRGDVLEVDMENNAVGRKLVVFPLVREGNNEEEHISAAIDLLRPVPYSQPPCQPRSHCRNLVDEGNNVEEYK